MSIPRASQVLLICLCLVGLGVRAASQLGGERFGPAPPGGSSLSAPRPNSLERPLLKAKDDAYLARQGVALQVTNPGVLKNDWVGPAWTGLTATIVTSSRQGSLTLTNEGGFTYLPASNFFGTDCFTYETRSGSNSFGIATVELFVPKPNTFFNDDFTRCTPAGSLEPLQVHSGSWSPTNGVLQGNCPPNSYGYCFLDAGWTNYSVEGSIQFPAGAYGGGIGGRLDPASGAHYAAWIFPDNSRAGGNRLALIKFSAWDLWGYKNTNFLPMAQANVPSVGTGWHPLKLVFTATNHIEVYYHGTNLISMDDTNGTVYSSGGATVELWTHPAGGPYNLSVDDMVVAP